MDVGSVGGGASRVRYARWPVAVCAVTVLLRWHTRNPEALAARFRRLGFRPDAGLRLRFDGGAVDLVRARDAAAERLELHEAEALSGGGGTGAAAAHDNGLRRLVAVGWATVDLDRAAADSGLGADRRTELAPDRVLGARAVLLGEGPVVLLEPDTEGRVAAALARFGEGPAAIYLATADGALPHGAGPAVSGPFGRSAALVTGDFRGPHVVACDGRPVPSTTIAP